MVLEATIIIVDNSESSRNGDYLPSRWDAQTDAISTIFTAKVDSNPESSVGLISMGGNGPEVLVTLTNDFGKILEGLHRTKIKGTSHLSAALLVAQLALRNRPNRSAKQRVIVFSCSPIKEEQAGLVKLAKRLKKGNVSVDIASFGAESDGAKGESSSNDHKLEAFVDNVKSTDGSHLVVVPPESLLSDALVATPILGGTGAGPSGAGGIPGGGDGFEGGGDFDFNMDMSSDPELALALRMSLEDEKARQEKVKREEEEKAAKEGKGQLENIAEEGEDESAPLLKKEDGGSASGSGSGSGAAGGASSSTSTETKKKDEDDKMDTA